MRKLRETLIILKGYFDFNGTVREYYNEINTNQEELKSGIVKYSLKCSSSPAVNILWILSNRNLKK